MNLDCKMHHCIVRDLPRLTCATLLYSTRLDAPPSKRAWHEQALHHAMLRSLDIVMLLLLHTRNRASNRTSHQRHHTATDATSADARHHSREAPSNEHREWWRGAVAHTHAEERRRESKRARSRAACASTTHNDRETESSAPSTHSELLSSAPPYLPSLLCFIRS